MPVYMVRAGENGPVKIGFTRNDMAERLAALQANNHERLTILRTFAGGRMEELRLHRRFAQHHIHGEWFAFTEDMLGDLDPGEFACSPGVDHWLTQSHELLIQMREEGVLTESEYTRVLNVWPHFMNMMRAVFAPAEAA